MLVILSDMEKLNLLQLIKLGREYLALWPNRRELRQYFAEYNGVEVARFVERYFPGIAVFIFAMQLYFAGISYLPNALVYLLFFLSLPFQSWIMMGLKADKFLPPSLASWYKEGVAKFNEQGGDIKLSVSKPRYLDLAKLLNLSYSK
ncbi:hypothetical protein SAMN05660429_01535 [Thalassotalea agarivorans]|uniref:UPF0208 membrane protein YfbV n=2 Tax=Thalassotalea agarivorans TaxID=349064 RepID=A0A1I0DJE3_THASX|nr:hypothetical protein SAMN05660429_01535 [Thalassotalea agarivorans]